VITHKEGYEQVRKHLEARKKGKGKRKLRCMTTGNPQRTKSRFGTGQHSAKKMETRKTASREERKGGTSKASNSPHRGRTGPRSMRFEGLKGEEKNEREKKNIAGLGIRRRGSRSGRQDPKSTGVIREGQDL